MKIGTMVSAELGIDVVSAFRKLKAMDLECCQISIWDPSSYTEENARRILEAAEETGIEITALWAGWTGPKNEWNFRYGPTTLGLVPIAWRAVRSRDMELGSRFAQLLGISDMITHVGFLPEDPVQPEFTGTIAAIRDLAIRMRERGQFFLLETGQETPVTILRAIEEIGTGNVGVNFDTANLILYGKANSLDALDMLGPYVRNTHCKDGFYPTCGTELGREVPLGEGKAQIREIVKKLSVMGYTGPLVIEREILGREQERDILRARDLLRDALAKI